MRETVINGEKTQRDLSHLLLDTVVILSLTGMWEIGSQLKSLFMCLLEKIKDKFLAENTLGSNENLVQFFGARSNF